MSDQLAQQRYTDLSDGELATVLADSQYFDDSKKSQALTKVLAGREMGFGPVTSLKNIHFVDGGIEIGGQLIASKIRQSGKYDYRIKQHTDKVCEVAITDSQGNTIGTVKWDIDRAKQAGLTDKHNWQTYPRNMLFNRAISDARRFYAPDVMEAGPYTPGEIPSSDNQPNASDDTETVEPSDIEVEPHDGPDADPEIKDEQPDSPINDEGNSWEDVDPTELSDQRLYTLLQSLADQVGCPKENLDITLKQDKTTPVEVFHFLIDVANDNEQLEFDTDRAIKLERKEQ